MENIITKLEVQKNNTKRVNVYINDDYAFSCHAELVYKYDLKKSKLVDLEQIKDIITADNLMKAKNDALKYLERSYKTEKELRDKLYKKGYDETTVQGTVAFLKEYNFLNDEKYAEMYIKDKQKRSGKNKLKYDLIKKGIDEEIIQEFTSKMDAGVEDDTAESLAAKKYQTIIKRETDKKKIYEKLLRFLVNKGFSWEIAKKAIEKVMEFQIEE
ncbi:recombination regulator RecX [Clostridium thermarum]|uniref:recombination regulator RecX n=1 Tax=Clostridium thermarum TaxID=1716543 RepID=UPI0011228077|nr:recombination regulator RecX [Clostridium thermarum]